MKTKCMKVYTEMTCTIYSLIGPEGCVAVDISLGKGGTEAVVESVYSAMGSQNQLGPISNETLTLRYS